MINIENIGISNYFGTLKRDLHFLTSETPRGVEKKFINKERVLAGARLITGAMFGVAAWSAFKTLPCLVSPSGIITIASSIVTYMAGHEVFIMARNISNEYKRGLGMVSQMRRRVTVRKDSLTSNLTQRTLLQPLWIKYASVWLGAVQRKFNLVPNSPLNL